MIRSFNDDTPYDRFVREQLAGDELADGGTTGNHRHRLLPPRHLGRRADRPRPGLLRRPRRRRRHDRPGLPRPTVDFARCHDHKIDPIPQKDYYRLVAFFRNVNHYRNGGPTDEAPLFDEGPLDKAATEAKQRDAESTLGQVRARIASIENDFLIVTKAPSDPAKRSQAPRKLAAQIPREGREAPRPARSSRTDVTLRKQLRAMRGRGSRPGRRPSAVTENGDRCRDVVCSAATRRTRATRSSRRSSPCSVRERRGLRRRPAVEVDRPPPGPGRLDRLGRQPADAAGHGQPGLAGAFWPGTPLRPATSALQGDKPTHPELLDWLAAEFLHDGWRLKLLHKRIVMSNTYRMSSRAEPKGLAAGPGERPGSGGSTCGGSRPRRSATRSWRSPVT